MTMTPPPPRLPLPRRRQLQGARRGAADRRSHTRPPAPAAQNLIDHEHFIPEKVGIPALREKLYGGGAAASRDDHLLHEFVELREATPQEVASMTPIGEVEEVVMRFETRAKESGGRWQGIAELLLDLGLPGV